MPSITALSPKTNSTPAAAVVAMRAISLNRALAAGKPLFFPKWNKEVKLDRFFLFF